MRALAKFFAIFLGEDGPAGLPAAESPGAEYVPPILAQCFGHLFILCMCGRKNANYAGTVHTGVLAKSLALLMTGYCLATPISHVMDNGKCRN